MRQGKVSELIHVSARYPDLQECSVEIHFRDIMDLPGDAYEVVPNSKLVVTRTAFKNNSSKYTINGRTVPFGDVRSLLLGRGIDLDHNRFLILQGEVESIAQMKPKAPTEHEDGLLEYLEDIIGTSKYKKPIEDAFAEVEALQEERQVKLNRLRLVEKEKQALEEQRREAINYYKMKNDHVRAQSVYFQWLVWQWLKRLDEAEGVEADIKKALEKETNKFKGDLEELENLQTHLKETEENYEAVRLEAEKGVKDLKEKEKEVVKEQEKQKDAAGRVKKLTKSVADETAALKKANRDIEDAEHSLEKHSRELEEHEANLEEEQRKLSKIQESLTSKTQVFHDQIQAKQKELQPWTAKIDAMQAEIDVRVNERDTLVKRAEDRKASLDEAEKSLADLEEVQKRQMDEQGGFKAKKDKLKRDIEQATQRFQTAQRNVTELRNQASSTRNVSKKRERVKLPTVPFLTVLKGKLGALGAIDPNYDVAISTAAGGPLSNLVVDTVGEGKTCIEYLRANNLGRASFMILEKLSDSNRMNPINTPENVPRLFDLIKPKDPMYRKAFYKAVGDTLVAKDLDQANRIAFSGKRYRVVTLAGQLIETSGAMSGGGGRPSSGAMSAKVAQDGVSPETLRKYELDAEKVADDLRKATHEMQEAEAEVDSLKRMGPELEMAYQKLGMEIETRKARITELGKRVKDLRAQNKPDAADIERIKVLNREIDAATAKLEQLQEKSEEITQAIAALEEKIMEIGGARLMSQKSKVEGLRTYISIANDAITKAEVTKAKAEKDVTRLTQSIKNNSKALDTVKAELDELNDEVQDLVAYRDQLKERVSEAQNELENQKEALDGIKTEVDKKESHIAGFRKKELDLKNKLADVKKEIEEVKVAVDKYQDSHDRLKLHDIEEDDDDDSDDEEETNKPEGSNAEGDEDAEMKTEDDAPRKPTKKGLELKLYTEQELSRFKQKELIADTELLDERIKNAKVDLTVLKEYKKREAEFDNRARDVEVVTEQRDAAKAKHDELCKKRLDEFMTGFNIISLKLKEMYQMITLGGNAELELVDSLDPFSEGIIFSVMPPKKSWKQISNLSGGEKTLSSLALVFALHTYKPTPLYFMDEIDAALDFRNVSIVANYIKDRTKNAQFIIISLRNDMFELSHRLIGIYKTANATRSISINNHKLLPTIPVNGVPPPAHPQPTNAAA
ncbi:hypothetical protein NMY22_g15359 [Coprinellus aureogranulatus]|nr:hypothetical protein NMY22_g15359 [Coprinellus aureogranulatus]